MPMMEALGSGQGFMRSARLDGATAQEDAARAHVATRPNGHRLAGNIPLEEELMVVVPDSWVDNRTSTSGK